MPTTRDLARLVLGGVIFLVGLLLWKICRDWPHQRGNQRLARGHCPRCDYDLTGNTSGRCPECGFVLSLWRR